MTLICQKWRARPKARRRVVPNAAERAVDDVLLWCIVQRQAGGVSKDIAAQIGRSREWVRTATNRVVKEDRDGLDYWAANPFPENKQKPRENLNLNAVATNSQSALIATGGREGALWAWAQENGKTMTQARSAWFALRLPLNAETQ